METLSVQCLTSARIPTVDGEFTLSLYENSEDDKDHLALVYGDIENEEDVLVRVHSECFTGDVLGSLRCDCGEQLDASMRRIASDGVGILLYLRQEGRGIGLHSKLKAYNLQDEGYDTVEANHLLGHGADERDYSIGAQILKDLGVQSIRLLTNNPEKIESLEEHGISVAERVPLQPHVNRHNSEYLRTKVHRMRHLLELGPMNVGKRENPHGTDLGGLQQRAKEHFRETGRPFVSLTYAQSLDGSITTSDRQPLSARSDQSRAFTQELRAAHDAVLVGVGSVLSEDPQLSARPSDGPQPIPVVLDTQLRFPLDARLLSGEGPMPIIVTNEEAPGDRQDQLEAKGATVLRRFCTKEGICLLSLLEALADRGIASLMVEGGTEVIGSVLTHRLADHFILAIAPMLVGGQRALPNLDPNGEDEGQPFTTLKNVRYRWLGENLILEGTPVWHE